MPESHPGWLYRDKYTQIHTTFVIGLTSRAMKYNYKQTSIADDRAAAEKIEARVQESRDGREAQGPEPNQAEQAAPGGEDDGQDAAARTLQKNYRLVRHGRVGWWAGRVSVCG